MDDSVVIKVKYGDTLRRFNAAVNEDQRLDLDMSQLRSKICSFFNFNPDANFTLTYVDEDDDNVTLVEDEDLHDVMRQSLDPLRITVTLNTDTSAQSSAEASGGSAPNVTSSQNLHQAVNPGVAEVLKSVPEPLLDALSKLSLDLASRAATTSPVVAQLVDNLSALRQAFLTAPVPQSVVAAVSTPDEVCNNSAASSGSKKPEPANNLKANGREVSQTTPESTTSSVSVEVAGHTKPAGQTSLPVFLNINGKFTKFVPADEVENSGIKKDKEIAADNSTGKPRFMKSLANLKLTRHDQWEKQMCKTKMIQEASGGDKQGFYNGKWPTRTNYDYVGGECPFLGSPIQRTHVQRPFTHARPPFDDLKFNATGMRPIVHKGVCCDVCGMLPILGARFKSTVKHDYDLCNSCFSEVANSSDYIRIDFPGQYKIPSSRPPVEKTRRSKLDSCFIMDVNVVDGTMMAPSTPFTKIWRMRNNGPYPWVRGLRLVWIQGDRFSASYSVEIEIPVGGVSVGGQIDIAVDFVAPETPGRYMSHWRMAEQSGLQFGQRVWVDIKVDASLNLTSESSSGLNLNLPPESCGIPAPTTVDVNVESVVGHQAGNLDCASETDKQSVVNQKRKIELEDLNFPINNDLINEVLKDHQMSSSRPDAASSPAPSVMSSAPPLPPVGGGSPAHSVESPVSYHEADASANLSTVAASCPIVDMSEESVATSIAKDSQRNPESDVEESLLMELEEMGFREVELNKEVLRMNAYDLERSVDELCGANEWDPILEELQEMGFHDKHTNRKLLAKNNGSIMRVVMDLISGEKA